MAKRKGPNQKHQMEILRESLINIQDPGPLKTLIEIGNADYYEVRALEAIEAARRLAKEASGTIAGHTILIDQYHENLKQAVSLLMLARCDREVIEEIDWRAKHEASAEKDKRVRTSHSTETNQDVDA